MVEEEPIQEILSLSNDDLPTESSPVFQTSLGSENYADLLSAFGTPPKKYISIDPLPSASHESPGKENVTDPLTFPEGSPVTPHMQEATTTLPEINFESEHYASYESKLLHTRQSQEKPCEEGIFAFAKLQTRSNLEPTPQNMETDFQELLELGKAMNLPSGPEIGTNPLCPVESGGTQRRQDENSDNIALLPFPLDDIFTPLTKEGITLQEHNCANQSAFSPIPNVTQSCPGSEIRTSHQLPASRQHCNPESANIDDILLEVASRNSHRYKRVMAMKGIQGEEPSTEASLKKRKVTSSSGENDREGNDLCSTSRGTGRKKSSKKGRGNCRTVSDAAGKPQTSLGSTPSRFCHICTRAAKPDVVLVCGNVAKGTCRKVICFKCIREMSWDWASLHGSDPWTCTHCREDCPAKAQCHTYRRVNQNRRADGRRSKKTTTASSTKMVESNDQKGN